MSGGADGTGAPGPARRGAAARRLGPRILVVDDLAPDPRLGFGFPRARLLLEALARAGHAPTVLGVREDRAAPPRLVRALAASGIAVARLPRGGLPAYLRRHRRSFDVIWASRPRNLRRALEALDGAGWRGRLVYDAEAVIAPREILRRTRRGAPPSPAEAEAMIAEEMALAARADLVVAVSGPDRAVLRRHRVGPVFLLGYPHAGPPTPRRFAERRDVLLVHGNLDGARTTPDWLRFYAGDVLARIDRRLDVAFQFAGYRSDLYALPPLDASLAGRIVRHGFVEDLHPLFDACRVMAVPTLVSGGISEKLVEALARGLPAVVSPLVAAQLGLQDRGRTVLVGRDADEFAAHLMRGYTDEALWNRLRRNGLAWARANRARFRGELARLDRALRGLLRCARV